MDTTGWVIRDGQNDFPHEIRILNYVPEFGQVPFVNNVNVTEFVHLTISRSFESYQELHLGSPAPLLISVAG